MASEPKPGTAVNIGWVPYSWPYYPSAAAVHTHQLQHAWCLRSLSLGFSADSRKKTNTGETIVRILIKFVERRVCL